MHLLSIHVHGRAGSESSIKTLPRKHVALGTTTTTKKTPKKQRAEQTLHPAAGQKHKVQSSQGWGLSARHVHAPRPAPRSELPDRRAKFTVTRVPPATASGPGKEFGWGRTRISPVPTAPAWAVPAQTAPEGSPEPSLVTNSIKTHPVQKRLAQCEANPREENSFCQPRLPTERILGYQQSGE